MSIHPRRTCHGCRQATLTRSTNSYRSTLNSSCYRVNEVIDLPPPIFGTLNYNTKAPLPQDPAALDAALLFIRTIHDYTAELSPGIESTVRQWVGAEAHVRVERMGGTAGISTRGRAGAMTGGGRSNARVVDATRARTDGHHECRMQEHHPHSCISALDDTVLCESHIWPMEESSALGVSLCWGHLGRGVAGGGRALACNLAWSTMLLSLMSCACVQHRRP
jgi:hypothetical protein